MLYSLKLLRLRYQYILADLFIYILSSFVLALIKFSEDFSVIDVNAYLLTLTIFGLIYLGLLYWEGNYEGNVLLNINWGIYVRSITYSAALFFVTSFYIRSVSYSRVYFTAFFIVTFVLAVFCRYILSTVHKRVYREGLKMPMLAVGFEKAESGALDKFAGELGLKIVAEATNVNALKEYRLWKERLTLLNESKINDELGIFLNEEGEGEGDYKELISFCELNYVPLYILPSANRMLSVPFKAVDHDGLLIFGPKDLIVDGVSKRLKRTIDVVLAILGIILTSWLMLLLWLVVEGTSKGPGLYAQERLGLDGRVIKIYKFRTMVNDSDNRLEELLKDEEVRQRFYQSYKLENDPRVTAIGRYLRRLSLDELPQLFNILRGDISFVGPRPIIPPELARYGTNGKLILRVKPGLTGLWQVNGRNDVSYEERIRNDLFYIHNWSLGLDFKIILQTVPAVVMGRGAS